MKIEKLTDNKIRIIFDLAELSKQNINLDNINKDKAHILFKEILNEAEKQVGFKAKNCKLLVESYSTTDGYVVFTLTKYSGTKQKEKGIKNEKNQKKNLSIPCKNAIYKFDSFDEFCKFCTYCNSMKFSNLNKFAKNISLYFYKNFYYLCFLDINYSFENTNLLYSLISEFAVLYSTSDIFKSVLDEHGKVIFKSNALKNGVKFFAVR